MKVKELIEQLQKEDPEKIIVLQKDPEGNGYREICGVDGNAVFVEGDDECYNTTWSAEEAGMDEDEWQEFKEMHTNCVVLWPM